ncbi:MAG: hypothetical protein Q4D91_04855 [Lautropia sp.]|nr:hypothetical protein [Lautropia sp.]
MGIDQALAEAERLYQAQQDAQALSLFHSIAELSVQHREQALFRMGNLHQRRGEKGLALAAYGRLMEVSMQAEIEAGTGAADMNTSGRQREPLNQANQPKQAKRQKGAKQTQQDVRTARIARQARQLKAMINVNLMAVEQSHQSLAWIEQLQQDPEVRAAVGLDVAMAARMSQQLRAQSEQVNQLMVRLGAWEAQSLNRIAHRPNDRLTHAWAPSTALPLGQANTRQRVTIVYDKPPRRAAKKAAAQAVPTPQTKSTGVPAKPEILSGGGSQPNQAAPTSVPALTPTPTPTAEVKEENASSVPQILMPSKPASDPSSTQGQPSTVGINEKEADHG